MYEMTLTGLLALGNSDVAKYDANWMVIEVQAYDSEPEIIINPKENFQSKLDYYAQAYGEDLRLKANTSIKIVRYDFVGAMEDCL